MKSPVVKYGKYRTYDQVFKDWYAEMPKITVPKMQNEISKILLKAEEDNYIPKKNRVLLNLYLIELSKRQLGAEIEELVQQKGRDKVTIGQSMILPKDFPDR